MHNDSRDVCEPVGVGEELAGFEKKIVADVVRFDDRRRWQTGIGRHIFGQVSDARLKFGEGALVCEPRVGGVLPLFFV